MEVNQTFYKVPLSRTVARWSADVHPGFRFSVKLWKGITHTRDLAFSDDDVCRFMDTMAAFGNSKGCLLIQFPAGLGFGNFERVARLLAIAGAHNTGWKIAVEFRHRDWYTEKVWHLLQQHHCCLVEHDMPKSKPPQELPPASFRFMRFHGVLGDYRGTYEDQVLAQYAAGIKADESAGREVYAYFNNTLGDAVHNALTLQHFVINQR